MAVFHSTPLRVPGRRRDSRPCDGGSAQVLGLPVYAAWRSTTLARPPTSWRTLVSNHTPFPSRLIAQRTRAHFYPQHLLRSVWVCISLSSSSTLAPIELLYSAIHSSAILLDSHHLSQATSLIPFLPAPSLTLHSASALFLLFLVRRHSSGPALKLTMQLI